MFKIIHDTPGLRLSLSDGAAELSWSSQDKRFVVKRPDKAKLSIPFSALSSFAAEISAEGSEVLALRLLFTYQDNDSKPTPLALTLTVERLDRQDEALDLLFRVAHVMGWEGYLIRQNNSERLVVELAPRVRESHPFRAGQAPEGGLLGESAEPKAIIAPVTAADYSANAPMVGAVVGGWVIKEWRPKGRVSLEAERVPTRISQELTQRGLWIIGLGLLSWLLTLLVFQERALFGFEVEALETDRLSIDVLAVWAALGAIHLLWRGALALFFDQRTKEVVPTAITIDWSVGTISVSLRSKEIGTPAQRTISIKDALMGLRVRQRDNTDALELRYIAPKSNEVLLDAERSSENSARIIAIGEVLAQALEIPFTRENEVIVRPATPLGIDDWRSPYYIGILAAAIASPVMLLVASSWEIRFYNDSLLLLPTTLILLVLSLRFSRTKAPSGASWPGLSSVICFVYSFSVGLYLWSGASALCIAALLSVLSYIINGEERTTEGALLLSGLWVSLIGMASALLALGPAVLTLAWALLLLGPLFTGGALVIKRSILGGLLVGLQVLMLIFALRVPSDLWTEATECSQPDLLAVWGSSEDKIYLLGRVAVSNRANTKDESVIFRSDDQGETWRPLWRGNSALSAIGGTATELYAVGARGAILHSDDQGETWQEQESGLTEELTSLWASPSGEVYLAGEDGLVLCSADRGAHWEERRAPSRERLLSIWGTSPNEVYVIESAAPVFNPYVGLELGASSVLRSTDGGKSWKPELTPPGIGLRVITGRGERLFIAGTKSESRPGMSTLLQRDASGAWNVMFAYFLEPLLKLSMNNSGIYTMSRGAVNKIAEQGRIIPDPEHFERLSDLWVSEAEALYVIEGAEVHQKLNPQSPWKTQTLSIKGQLACP